MGRFTRSQILRLANIFDNAGQILLATLVLPPLLSRETYRLETSVVVLGALTTLASWWISLRLERIGGS